jgi:septum formation protein
MTTAPVFWRGEQPLVLASGSASRRQMLEAAGIPIVVKPTFIDERALADPLIEARIPPKDIARRLALAKGVEASRHAPNRVVLAADQTLELEDRLGMKPESVTEARHQLRAMRGKAHFLHAAACLVQAGTVLWEGTETAELTMRSFSDAFLEAYLDRMGNQVCSTVGAYEYEALGVHLFETVNGAHATILGLPLAALLDAMRRLGLLLG